MIRAIRMSVVAALVVTALLGYHPSAPVDRALSSGMPHCSSVQLLISPINKGLGAALGHVGRWYRMRDVWGGPCNLQGFPGVELLDRNFHTLLRRVKRGHGMIISGSPRPRLVMLNQQHDAYFALEFTDIQKGNASCRSVPYLIITPPNGSLPVVTHSGGIAPCPGDIIVSPVEPTPILH
jgi:Protein of unknown function (DUF4232)